MTKKSETKEIVEAVREIVEAVPVYQDAVQPAAKEVGKALETVAKTINLALAPIAALVWGYDQIKYFISTRVAEKLKDVPLSNIQTPNPTVVGPALEALRYTGHEEVLREMYANLLASAINVDTAKYAHPAFVDIIKNMTSDEAKIMNQMALVESEALISMKAVINVSGTFNYVLNNYSGIARKTGCSLPDYISNYIDNLCRLGLLEIPSGLTLANQDMYDKLINDPYIQDLKKLHEKKPGVVRVVIENKGLAITDFGKQFSKACILPKSNI
jgi:hypothetical protein